MHAPAGRCEVQREALRIGYAAVARLEGRALVLRDGRRWPVCGTQGLGRMLDVPYPTHPSGYGRADAGRTRHEGFLRAVYGDDAAEVRDATTPVSFFGVEVAFNKRNGAASALRRVAKRIATDAELVRDLKALGTRYESGEAYGHPGHRIPYIQGISVLPTRRWRRIAGSGALSMHSLGIAIDIVDPEARTPQYWRWLPSVRSAPDEPRKEAVLRRTLAEGFVPAHAPAALIAAFEAEGFLYGGTWRHFDTMHFEYRPALLQLARGGAKP